MSVVAQHSAARLPSLVKQAAAALARAETAAEVLAAGVMADAVYVAAKRAARLAKAKGAHDELVAAAHRAQADALEIESLAKRRLADEYDAAQARGDVAKKGKPKNVPDGNIKARAEEIGLTRKQIFDARAIRDAVAEDPGIVRRVLDDMLASGDEPTRAAVKRAVQPVATAIRAEVQAAKKERRQEREFELGARQTALPEKRYGIIYADPEWRFRPYSAETGMDRAADNHYPTSDLKTLMSRDVGRIAAEDCVLFLWATVPMLVEAICVADAWGFCWLDRAQSGGHLMPMKNHARYVSSWAWFKEKEITGYWTRGKHELLLVFTRGKPVAPAMGEQLPSWVAAESVLATQTHHSAKPEIFVEWIDRLWPATPKIELNRRGTARPGWDAWGNEVGSNPVRERVDANAQKEPSADCGASE